MKLSLFFAAIVTSLLSLSTAAPIEYSVDLEARGLGDLELSDMITRDLGYRDLPDLSTREFADVVVVRAPAKPARAKTPAAGGKAKPPKGAVTSCRKRSEPCLNLFVVWYAPYSGSARHWSLFLTASSTPQGSTGTIYQAVAHRAPPFLAPERRPHMVASDARHYEGGKFLLSVTETLMETYYDAYKHELMAMIGDHNADRANLMCQSNCQQWVRDMAGVLANVNFSGVPT
ncbi:hypothetical protein FPV67DRAFT_1452928 [Lyophyllum atratum]|nr:hypothetical protein FPV67DRAFT_1452928 [Lyophyllum atratum]